MPEEAERPTFAEAEPALAPAAAHATENATDMLYRAVIGPVGAAYYDRVFSEMDTAERTRVHWNWAASLFTLNWLVFRRLWNFALYYCGAVVGAALLIFGIGRLVFQFSETLEMSLASAFAALLFVLPGLFGNAIFHADCRRRMTDALRSSADERDAAQTLLPVGGTRRRLTAIVLANAVLLALAFAAALQWMELANSAGSLPLASHRPGAEPLVTASVASPVAPSATHSATPVASAQVAANIVVSTPQVPAIPVQAPGCDGCLRTVTGSNGRSVQGPVRSDPSVAATATGTTAKTPAPAGSKPAKVKASPSVAKAPEASADGTLRPYLINVGLFAVPSNAANAYDKLIESGLPATSQPLSTTKGPRTRVRVGPFETREQAREAVQRIQALALEAVIIQP